MERFAVDPTPEPVSVHTFSPQGNKLTVCRFEAPSWPIIEVPRLVSLNDFHARRWPKSNNKYLVLRTEIE